MMMKALMPLKLPSAIRVDVDFYDEAEKDALLAYPTADKIYTLVEEGLQIPEAEFLTYLLFHRKRTGASHFSSYSDLARVAGDWLVTLEGCVESNGSSIISAKGIEKQPTYVTEHVGEAIGLAAINRIHGLTEADWTPIPQESGPSAHKTLDYEYASDGNFLIQVENKGSAVEDNRKKTQPIWQHKSAIISKKAAQNSDVKLGAAVIRYGTIAVLDKRLDGKAKCWLTDPDGPSEEISPRNAKLLKRLYFLARWISLVAPRSQLASALMTRVRAIRSLKDPYSLNNVPLLRGSGAEFENFRFGTIRPHSTFMSSRPRVKDGPAGGGAIRLKSGPLFFLGFREDLLDLASRQSFEQINSYARPPASLNKTVVCEFSRLEFQRLGLPDSIASTARRAGNRISFELSGLLHYSASGLIFGLLPLPEA